jgi:hypothetical protein
VRRSFVAQNGVNWQIGYMRALAIAFCLTALLGMITALAAGSLFRAAGGSSRNEDPFAHLSDSERARWGAKWVIPVTGIAAVAVASGLVGGEPLPGLMIGLIVTVFMVASWIAARYVAKHGDEPGEARFDTRNSEERGS